LGGSALNLKPHLHLLCIDGVYTRYGDVARFRNLESISDEEVESLVDSIANRVRSRCIKRGYLGKDGDIVLNPALDPLFQDHESLSAALAASISGNIAFGPNAGNYVRKIGGGFGYEGEVPLDKGKRYYSVNGFSIHANTAVNAHALIPPPRSHLVRWAPFLQVICTEISLPERHNPQVGD